MLRCNTMTRRGRISESGERENLLVDSDFIRQFNNNDDNGSSFRSSEEDKQPTLSVFFATLCVIDLFGVFPIVTLPHAIILCGLYGIPLAVFVISLQIYTAVILGKCWIKAEKLDPTIITKNRYPYAAIAELTYGKYMSVLVTILLDLTVFGGGIPNLLVASQNLQLLGLRLSDGAFDFSFCYWLIIIGVILCPILWLGSPKNMKVLATLSVFIVSSVAVLTWYCLLLKEDKRSESFEILQNITTSNDTFSKVMELIQTTEHPDIGNLLKAYGIIAFQFDIHPMLLTIQVDMKNKRGIGKSVSLGILFTITMSAITTVFVVLRYGIDVTPNVLESLPRSWALYITILLVTLQLCLSSAVGNSALFQHVEDVFKTSRQFTYKRCLIRSSLVLLAIVIGELLPRFDMVMGVIGGTLTGPLIFILPPLFYTRISRLEEIHDEIVHEIEQNLIMDGEQQNEEEQMGRNYGAIPRIRIESSDYCCCSSRVLRKILSFAMTIWKSLFSDCVISIFVVAFGLCATLVSTYTNLFDLSQVVEWSPCLSNQTFGFLKL